MYVSKQECTVKFDHEPQEYICPYCKKQYGYWMEYDPHRTLICKDCDRDFAWIHAYNMK